MRAKSQLFVKLLGFFLFPIIWITLKSIFGIPDRFLPSPIDVINAAFTIKPNIFEHMINTFIRIFLGIIGGTFFGIGLGMVLWRSFTAKDLFLPTLQSFRAIPAIAVVPFFLLWFGFSDIGKIVLIITTIGFNLSVSTYQALLDVDEKYRIAFLSFNKKPKDYPISFGLYYVSPILLPTIRYSVTLAIAAIIVAELLGSQVGLGYLIQTSRATFSMNAVLLACIMLGIITVTLDWIVCSFWRAIIFWRPINEKI